MTPPPPKSDELQPDFGGAAQPGAEGSIPARTTILLLIGGFDTTCDGHAGLLNHRIAFKSFVSFVSFVVKNKLYSLRL